MTGERSRRVRIACWMSLGTLAAILGPAACIFPQYTFDEDVATGGASATSGPTSSGASMHSSSEASSGVSTSSAGGGMSGTSASSSASTSASTGSTGGSGQGGASASSSEAASTSVSSSSGTGTQEDCLDGSDNDGDGDTDCGDSDCMAGYVCVDNVPFGWSGFATLFEGLPAQEPQCPAAFPTNTPFKAYNTLMAGPANCSACTCGSPTGQTCDLPDAFTIRNKPCGQISTYNGTINVPSNWTGTCYGDTYYFPGGQTNCSGACNQSISSPSPATASGGSCGPAGGSPNVPPANWTIMGKACGDAGIGGGCGGNMKCQPRPSPPFLSGLCISKGGDSACPAGNFTQKHLFYDGFNDTRGCSACSCSTPSGSTCSATVTFYSDLPPNVCGTSVATVPTGGCGNLTGNPNVGARSASNIMFSGGSCSPSGGQPNGTATPTGATTYCCVP